MSYYEIQAQGSFSKETSRKSPGLGSWAWWWFFMTILYFYLFHWIYIPPSSVQQGFVSNVQQMPKQRQYSDEQNTQKMQLFYVEEF